MHNIPSPTTPTTKEDLRNQISQIDEQIQDLKRQIHQLEHSKLDLKYTLRNLPINTPDMSSNTVVNTQTQTRTQTQTQPQASPKYKDPNQRLGRPRKDPSQLAPSTRAQYDKPSKQKKTTSCQIYAERYAQQDVVNYKILSQLPLAKAREIFFNMDYLTVEDSNIAMRKCILHSRYAYTLTKCDPNGPFRLDPNQLRFHSPECVPEWELHRQHLLTVVTAFATLLQVPIEQILSLEPLEANLENYPNLS